jgi:hypothetical protein
MNEKTKKLVGLAGGVIGISLIVMALINAGVLGFRYIQNARYEQEIKRLQLEYTLDAAEKHKAWVAAAPKREAEAKIEAERKQAEWAIVSKQREAESAERHRQRLIEFNLDAQEAARKREEYRIEQAKIHRERAAQAEAQQKEFMDKIAAQEEARRAQLRKLADDHAASKAAKPPAN